MSKRSSFVQLDGEVTFHLSYGKGDDEVDGCASTYKKAEAKAIARADELIKALAKGDGWKIKPSIVNVFLCQVDDLAIGDFGFNGLSREDVNNAENWYFEVTTDL